MSADYFQEIEAHFARRRGTPFVVSAKDWALMKEWSEAGIPLAVVIEAMDAVFDKKATEGRTVNGLRFCRHAVKEMWLERRELQVGAETDTPEETSLLRLETLADILAESEHAAVVEFAPRVRELARAQSVPRIEEALIALESELIEALLPQAPSIRDAAEALAAGADEKSRARSQEAHLRRLVRDHFSIPRLTLF